MMAFLPSFPSPRLTVFLAVLAVCSSSQVACAVSSGQHYQECWSAVHRIICKRIAKGEIACLSHKLTLSIQLNKTYCQKHLQRSLICLDTATGLVHHVLVKGVMDISVPKF